MKGLLGLVLVVALVPAAGAASVRSVTAPAPVLAVAFDGARIAYATGRSAGDCNRVYVWNLTTRGVSKLGRKTHCEQTSTGNAIAAVSIAGTRVLWVHYAGGNFRDWSLWTATTTKPSPTRLRLVTREADAPAPIVIGPGDGAQPGSSLLPYAVDRTVIALRTNGSRAFSWTAPARVVSIAARGGELAVATGGGVVTVLDAGGHVLRTESYPSEIAVVRITDSGVLVQRGRTLELRGAGAPRTKLLPGRARLEDALGTQAFYVTGGQIRQISMTGSLHRQLGLGSHVAAEGSSTALSSVRRVTLRQL